jgi:hypothetical protein
LPATHQGESDKGRKQVTVHPELMRSLRYLAADLDLSVPETLHLVLCERFARPDLMMRDPEPAGAR